MSNAVTHYDYTQYLRAMYPIIFYCEHDLYPLTFDVVPDIEIRKKISLIKKDIEDSVQDNLPSDYPSFKLRQPQQPTVAQSLGFMYVIEGSTLGGLIILKHLRNKGIIDNNATSFFLNAYGGDVSKNWGRFLKYFSSYCVEKEIQEDVIQAATAAFITIRMHFLQVNKKEDLGNV